MQGPWWRDKVNHSHYTRREISEEMFKSFQNKGSESIWWCPRLVLGVTTRGATTLHNFINLPDIKIINKQVCEIAWINLHKGFVSHTCGSLCCCCGHASWCCFVCSFVAFVIVFLLALVHLPLFSIVLFFFLFCFLFFLLCIIIKVTIFFQPVFHFLYQQSHL